MEEIGSSFGRSLILQRGGDRPPTHQLNWLRELGRTADVASMAISSVIHRLHKLQDGSQATWSQMISIPEPGILMTSEQGEVFSRLRHDIDKSLISAGFQEDFRSASNPS